MDRTSYIVQNRGKPILLQGNNFSGRTSLLRRWCVDFDHARGRTIYVGPDVHQSISSLVPTVGDELLLHADGSRQGGALLDSAKIFGLGQCLDQNPFTLSGGEQVLLVTLAKLALGADVLMLDGTLEQLDQENSDRVIELLRSDRAAQTTTILTNNGYPEDRRWHPSECLAASEFSRENKFADVPHFRSSDFRCIPAVETGSLEVDGLSFSYTGRSSVLRNVQFRLEPGHIYSLEGRNGAGKSTLARLLTGASRASSGRFSFNGQKWNPWTHPGRHVVMHMQNPDIQLFADSVKKELSDLPESIGGAAATFAGVDHLLAEHPFDLSFVFRKRLTFSAVAHLAKPWFIFDEPTLGQDPAASDQIVAVLKKISKAGAGVIVISHSKGFLSRLEPRRLRIANGCLSSVA